MDCTQYIYFNKVTLFGNYYSTYGKLSFNRYTCINDWGHYRRANGKEDESTDFYEAFLCTSTDIWGEFNYLNTN